MSWTKPPKVGSLRPTQVVSQRGPGAVVDLPELSVVIAGIDEWRVTGADRIAEPRLEAFLRVTGLFRPPATWSWHCRCTRVRVPGMARLPDG